jgi:hypothetical protein
MIKIAVVLISFLIVVTIGTVLLENGVSDRIVLPAVAVIGCLAGIFVAKWGKRSERKHLNIRGEDAES